MRIPRRESDDEDSQVQMAPLIDCVFLLLIFFLVATVLKKMEEELPVDLPLAAGGVARAEEPDLLILGVDAAGRKYIGGQPVSQEMLHQRIRLAAQEDPGRRVRIDADKNSRYMDIIHVIELCQFEGLRDVGFHTRRETRP